MAVSVGGPLPRATAGAADGAAGGAAMGECVATGGCAWVASCGALGATTEDDAATAAVAEPVRAWLDAEGDVVAPTEASELQWDAPEGYWSRMIPVL